MDRHAHPEGSDTPPGDSRQLPLPGDGGAQRVGGGREGGAQPVAGVGELATVMGGDGLLEHGVMPGEVRGHGRPVALPEPGAGLDVGEQERERPAGVGLGGGRRLRRGRRRRQRLIELRALLQELAFESLDARGRLQTEFLGQGAAKILVGRQRLGLPAESVQRQHLQAPEALPEGVIPGQGLHGVEGGGRAAGGQLRGGQILGHVEPGLVQADRRHPG